MRAYLPFSPKAGWDLGKRDLQSIYCESSYPANTLSFYVIVSFLVALSIEIGSGDKKNYKYLRDPIYTCFSSDKKVEEITEKVILH